MNFARYDTDYHHDHATFASTYSLRRYRMVDVDLAQSQEHIADAQELSSQTQTVQH